MKLISFLLLLSIFSSCNNSFEVVSATRQKWAGGVPDAGHGENYKFTLVAKKSSSELKIDQLWVGEEFYKIQAYKNLANKKDNSFENSDTIYFFAQKREIIYRDNLTFEKPKKEIALLPIKHSGEALIGYNLKGKRKYQSVETIKKIKFLAYP